MSDRLFAVPEPVATDTGPQLSPDARRTVRNHELLAAGIHPATRRPLLNVEPRPTCSGCRYAVQHRPNLRTFWKCERHHLGITFGAASDIRLRWPACGLFQLRETGDG